MSTKIINYYDLVDQFYVWGVSLFPFFETSWKMERDLKAGVQEPSAIFHVPDGVALVVMIQDTPRMYRLDVRKSGRDVN